MHVDDLIITGNHDDHIAQVKKELQAGFKMIDLGLLHYYLGVEVFQRPHHIFISQSKYAAEFLQQFGMQDCKPVLTPMEQNLKLSKFEGGERNHKTATGMQPKEFFDISKEQNILVFFTQRLKILYLVDIPMPNLLEVLMIEHQHQDLGISQSEATSLFIDSQSAIKLAKNPVFHSKTKHVDTKYHHIRSLIAKDVLKASLLSF
eukprot:PITA_09103